MLVARGCAMVYSVGGDRGVDEHSCPGVDFQTGVSAVVAELVLSVIGVRIRVTEWIQRQWMSELFSGCQGAVCVLVCTCLRGSK
jgi:hypothetical protein